MAQWWDEWQLRILVLASLIVQFCLVFSGRNRLEHLRAWYRVWLRLAHIGCDPLALFTLATLFNRQKDGPRCSYARGSRDLELLWAPILLMHLGGQVVITTYKIEDNEKWSRHILTSLSKVTAALYVFYKSWSADDKRLLAATILLFILVILKCFQKALNLRGSSFSALRKASSSEVVQATGLRKERLKEYVEKAKEVLLDCGGRDEKTYSSNLPSLPDQIFLDFPRPYSERAETLKKFWVLNPISACQAIEGTLSAMTSFLYTKNVDTKQNVDTKHHFPLMDKPTLSGRVLFLLKYKLCYFYLYISRKLERLLRRGFIQGLPVYATLITVICLVHTRSQKQAYSGADSKITLVLLYFTLLMELVLVISSDGDSFHTRILQHNLIGLLAHNKWHYTSRRIAGWLHCKDFLNLFWHMGPVYSCVEITELARQHIESGWNGYIQDTETYRWFTDTRGERTLASKGCPGELGRSIKRPFDETIVLWHLATDLCFHHKATSPGPGDDRECPRQCKEMSNYMMHLLFANPKMLMPGSRKGLFATAYSELEEILKTEETPRGEREFTQKVIEICDAHRFPDTFIGDAWVLAKSLLGYELDDPTRKWEVIKGVWMEMLCFSASRCQGYWHAETLGTGVEFLSYVWVLLQYSGMETFSEKLQKREGMPFDSDESLV
ncbi:hypothetical protein CFC21_026432 [Triticum aestivum]|uniref:DUF4220 domain-containing protein n=3 Tax=Triticum TaxID=4564 RepID=A0A9R1JCM6_WHEAT|nr:hypothetical protein CFC21_026394 [Triticum aestivum]KAF7012217.1 hypothetical protein CFC21_026432 [Triticum aestivum]VAH54132.1 unnamed protein product [Triticum turgidum subsp. durum]